MKVLAQSLAVLLALMGGPVVFRIWASRRYARRTGKSLFAGIAWHWIFERIGGSPPASRRSYGSSSRPSASWPAFCCSGDSPPS